jgi:putative redox protein
MTTLIVQLEQVGPSTMQASARTHSVLVDRPSAKGGADRGPLGGEYLLVALGGCFASNLLAAIRARDAAMTSLRIEVSGELAGPPDRFQSFQMTVAADHHDVELGRRLIAIAARACAVTNTLRLSATVSIMFENAPVDLPSPESTRVISSFDG